MEATPKVLLTLFVIGFGLLNEVVSRDFKWFFEPLKCHPNYTEGVHETWEAAENADFTDDQLRKMELHHGEKAMRDKLNKDCSHLADDDACMMECIFIALEAFILQSSGKISFELNGLWGNIYHHTNIGVPMSDHVVYQCENHIPEKLSSPGCVESRGIIDCVMSYMIYRSLEDQAPFHYFPGACHKLFARKAYFHYARETKPMDFECHRKHKGNFLCQKACMLNKMEIISALGTQDIHMARHWLNRFGMGDRNLGESEVDDANGVMAEELVASCKHLYKPFMNSGDPLCPEKKDDWEAVTGCVENYFGCKY